MYVKVMHYSRAGTTIGDANKILDQACKASKIMSITLSLIGKNNKIFVDTLTG
jgi:hypothetical protein